VHQRLVIWNVMERVPDRLADYDAAKWNISTRRSSSLCFQR
jgi:hypothetical protein